MGTRSRPRGIVTDGDLIATERVVGNLEVGMKSSLSSEWAVIRR